MALPQQPWQPAEATLTGDATQLKNYLLFERIGQDELSVIYRAQHQTLDREVHVHILRRPDWIAVSRFQLWARLGARFSHPHILPVLDAGYEEPHGYYLVTPALDARQLQALLGAGPVDVLLALRIFAQIGQALDFLHNQGVIHRDVQPQTILVTPAGQALLTDFSLAWTSDGPDLSQLAEAEYLTPYAAPEQTFEEEGTTTTALDIYALGAVLQHMLSGETPPSGAEQATLAAGDPRRGPAGKVIRRIMAPRPELRYTTAAQAMAVLRSALRPVLAETAADLHLADAADEASWVDNPLEMVLGDLIDPDYLRRSQERTERLHAPDGIRRFLDTWSSGRPERRRQLGQAIRVEQVITYNLYFYDLKVLYETRTVPQIRERPYAGSMLSSREPQADRWRVDVPTPPELFADVPVREVRLPHSERSLRCPQCQGEKRTSCTRCSGYGTLEVERTVRTATGRRSEVQVVDCPACDSAGVVTCSRCDGTGGLLEEKVFNFSRRGRLCQSSDDLEGLPRRIIRSRSEQVFVDTVDIHDPRWHAVPPLHELFEEAASLEQDDTKIAAAELTIRATPITEVDYALQSKPRTLAIIGFDQSVRGDLSLWDVERIVFVTVIAVLLVLLVLLYSTRAGV